jgi:hypothetical protein
LAKEKPVMIIFLVKFKPMKHRKEPVKSASVNEH